MNESDTPVRGRSGFVQDAIRLIGNNFLIMIVSFLSGVVLARCLGSEGRGTVAAIMVYPTIFIHFMDLGVRQSSTYFLGKETYSVVQIVAALSVLAVVTSVLGVVICGFLIWFSGNEAFTPSMIVLAVSCIPFLVIQNYASGVFLGRRIVGLFAKIQRMAEVQRFFVVLVLVWAFDLGIVGALIGTTLAAASVGVYAAMKTNALARIRLVFDAALIWSLVKKGIIFAVALFILTLNYRLDIILMEKFSNLTEIGIYSIAVSIAQLTWALPQSITTALFSHSANAKDELAFSFKVAKLFRVSLVLSVVVVAGLAALSPLLIPRIYGAEFVGSVRAVYYLLPGVFFLLALKVLNIDLAGRGKPSASLYATIPSLIINIVTNVVLLPKYGAVGAAIASSASYCVAGVGIMVLFCRTTSVSMTQLWSFRRSDFDFVDSLAGKIRRAAIL